MTAFIVGVHVRARKSVAFAKEEEEWFEGVDQEAATAAQQDVIKLASNQLPHIAYLQLSYEVVGQNEAEFLYQQQHPPQFQDLSSHLDPAAA
jgi:hypothetical protein